VRYKSISFYLFILVLFLLTLFYVEGRGKQLERDRSGIETESAKNQDLAKPVDSGNDNKEKTPSNGTHKHSKGFGNFHTTLIQIIIIITLAGIFGYLFRIIGQPSVIGEIFGGILLGPSFLGWISPDLFQVIFPPESFSTLELLSQLGLCLFMFIIGMEMDLSLVRRSALSAIIISHSSILVPFMLGLVSAIWIFPNHSSSEISFLSFSLFMGIAMSITAFPVLARILQERGLTKTHLGSLALTAAAINDVTAWSFLTVIVAIVNSTNYEKSFLTFLYSAIFIFLMLYVVRPLLKRASRVYVSRENLTKSATSVIFLLILMSSLFTETIGIHALFGAFLAGTIMPAESNLRKLFIEKIEDFSMVVLLPLFFAFTGLRTNIELLSGDMTYIFILLLGFAITGKIGGSAIAGLITGENLKNSLSIGILMNTRGLIELIVLNIGYDLGILSDEIFTVLVAVALITTVMTGPLLNGIQYFFPEKDRRASVLHKMKNILISFADPIMSVKLLKVIYGISASTNRSLELTALHITPYFSMDKKETAAFRQKNFEYIEDESRRLGMELHTLHRVTDQVTGEIIRQTIQLGTDLLLVGAARSFFSNKLLGGKVKKILEYSACSTGILIDSGFTEANDILVLSTVEDAQRLILFMESMNPEWKPKKNSLALVSGDPIKSKFSVIPESSLTYDFLGNYDLVICSDETWRQFEVQLTKSHTSSFLILNLK